MGQQEYLKTFSDRKETYYDELHLRFRKYLHNWYADSGSISVLGMKIQKKGDGWFVKHSKQETYNKRLINCLLLVLINKIERFIERRGKNG